MKYALFFLFSLCACLQGSAQQVEFKTFIYTSNDLGEEIATEGIWEICSMQVKNR